MVDDRRVLEGVTRLVVDGTNVLFALRRSPAPLPAAALIGRLRSMVPPTVAITVVLDGSPEHGLVARHVASGVEVRYSGRSTADELIAHLVQERYRPEVSGILVVTDDIELSSTVRRSGGRIVRNAWLIGRLERQRLSAPTTGRPGLVPPAMSSIGRAPARSGEPSPNGGPGAGHEDSDGPRWSGGRGATRKRGNGHRRPAGEK
jgi:YacP-like NYN domain